jgi:Aspartyl aminopeptidase
MYYVSRSGNSLIAFRMGLRFSGDTGFLLAGAHTDSPSLKLRPEKQLKSKGYLRLALESYGSPILSGWLDRPLGVAGNVAVREGSDIHSRLFVSDKPFAVIPNLAIHLNREINKGC